MDTLKVRRGSGKAATRRTGPNDAIHVVWAISKCFFNIFRVFFFFFSILNQLYRFYDNVEVRMDTQEGTTRKTSPNDAIHVVWANSTCFFFHFRFFSLLIYIYRSYGATDRLTGGYNKKNGPKRTRITSFGPFVSLLLLLFVFLYIH